MELLAALFDPDVVEQWIQAGGYLVLFALLFSCGVGVPLPEDIPLLAAGFLVARGNMHLFWAGVFAWLGIIGGDCVLYHFGKKYGHNITRVPFVGKHITEKRIARAEALFDKYGIWVVAVGRLFAGVRAGMVVAAGTIRFSFVRFVIADGLAAVVSGGLFIALGYLLGRTFPDIKTVRQHIEHYQVWVMLGIAVAAGLVILYLWWRSKRHQSIGDVVIAKAEKVATEQRPAH